ncbi:MAG: nucleic acid-binding protein [Candidatus Solibacter sp.]|nr:nucleic acid-binding protein [Candidatus Solibacter sp.]
MIRTYIDSGILIAAARGAGLLAERALEIIRDTRAREFVCSDYVRLEVIPKPSFEGHAPEVQFYEEFFKDVTIWAPFDSVHFEQAFEEACRSGLSALDALHVVAAAATGCQELITSEKPTKPIHRTQLVRTVSIDIG